MKKAIIFGLLLISLTSNTPCIDQDDAINCIAYCINGTVIITLLTSTYLTINMVHHGINSQQDLQMLNNNFQTCMRNKIYSDKLTPIQNQIHQNSSQKTQSIRRRGMKNKEIQKCIDATLHNPDNSQFILKDTTSEFASFINIQDNLQNLKWQTCSKLKQD